MKNLLLIVFVAAIIGCNGQASQPDLSADVIGTPPLSTAGLTSIEMRHYRSSVEEFIDSAFGSRAFNGSILVAKNGEVIYESMLAFGIHALSVIPFHPLLLFTWRRFPRPSRPCPS
ncbi:MAG: hypothetical protein EOO01_24130 [Chitinophagaceae bacterium]|nr:MAG: hypothetical protein EOO01_24130 [Chitinophagaceae bacterium]